MSRDASKKKKAKESTQGDILYHYDDLNKVLAEGPGETVCLYKHKVSGARVAVKEIRMSSKAVVDRATKEINITRKLKGHPNVIEMREHFLEPNWLFFVYGLYHSDLGSRVEEIGRCLTELETHEIITQVSDGLQWMHSRGVAHRDLKMANILVKNANSLTPVVISDFDHSFSSRTGDGNPQMFSPVGSIGTMAPEITKAWAAADETGECSLPYSKKCDVWSLGAIVFCLLTGTFSREAQDLLNKLLAADPELRPGIDQAVQHIWFRSGKRSTLAAFAIAGHGNSSDDEEMIREGDDQIRAQFPHTPLVQTDETIQTKQIGAMKKRVTINSSDPANEIQPASSVLTID